MRSRADIKMVLAFTVSVVSTVALNSSAQHGSQTIDYREFGTMSDNSARELGNDFRQTGEIIFNTNYTGFMNNESIEEALVRTIVLMCPDCRTTSTGNSIKVSYSKKGRDKEVEKVKISDSYLADEIADKCEMLVDEHGDEKDIYIVNSRNEDTLAVCFDDD